MWGCILNHYAAQGSLSGSYSYQLNNFEQLVLKQLNNPQNKTLSDSNPKEELV